jgi:hypothetical protein
MRCSSLVHSFKKPQTAGVPPVAVLESAAYCVDREGSQCENGLGARIVPLIAA